MQNLAELKRAQINQARRELEKQGKKLEDFPWPGDEELKPGKPGDDVKEEQK